MNQTLMKQIKNLVIDNRLLDDATIQTNIMTAMDTLIQQNTIYDYTLVVEVGRIVVSVQTAASSSAYAFQVIRA